IKDIEEIANEYDRAMKEYDLMVEFEKTTHNDNEYILQFIEDMEKKLPVDTKINNVECVSGEWKMEVTTGWHDKNKNEVADVIVQMQKLDYVRNLKIDSVNEEYKGMIVVGQDEEGNLQFATKAREIKNGDAKDEEGTPIEFVDPKNMDDAEKDEYGDFPVITLVQSTYNLSCHIGAPEEEEETQDEGEAAASDEEGGAAE
ncbi:MAG: hypothetical protein K6G22_07970, partial [Lachnospiraceae bacterium]|nr:hypothetical protein [Lachnospiraceae bacterium]